MTPEQRREAIARLLEDCPEASQRVIAQAVDCSQATVARDMAKLSGDSVIHIGDSPGVESADVPPVPVANPAPTPTTTPKNCSAKTTTRRTTLSSCRCAFSGHSVPA
jgi:hypothetical protein